MKYRIALLAIVGMIANVSPPGATAQSRSPAKVPAKSAPVLEATRADAALVEARQAFVRNDPIRFEAAAARAGDHVLAEYLDFWRLRMQMQSHDVAVDAQATDRQVRQFLARHRETVIADLVRRDWMLDLGKRRHWDLFDAQYAAWVLRDDDDVHCYHWLGRVERGLPADGALAQLHSVRHLGDACGDLLSAMFARQVIDRGAIERRLRVGLEHDSRDSVERTAGLLALDLDAVATAWSRPSKALAANGSNEIALIALSRLARADPNDAVVRIEQLAGRLNSADLAFAWAQIAAAGMRVLAPQAYAWFRLGSQATISDVTRVWLARAALREQDWPTLRTIVAQMGEETRGDPTWVYWQARALIAGGDRPAGEALLGTIAGDYDFYGQLAAEELGRLFRTPPRPTPPTKAELSAAARKAGFARALKFYDIGLRLEGNREWNFQLRGMTDRQLLAAAQWACSQRVLDRCVNTAERTREEHDFGLRFVTPFFDELQPVAAARGLDPAWIYGLIRQESRFIMDARSPVGAQGLMQIMPATGKWIARKLGVRDFRVAHLNDLPTNIEFGTFYLKTVLDDLSGSPVLASAAYNAGPGRPRNWRASLSGPIEGAIFAEIIPFPETRNYVKKVLSNAVVYAEMLSGEPQSLKAWLGTVAPPPAAPLIGDPLAVGEP